MPEPRPATVGPQIGLGEVRHTRLRPVLRAFAYPTFFVLLPMRQWRREAFALPRNRFGLVSFHDRDHGDGRADKQTVFADKLHLPIGFELAPEGVYLSQEPNQLL